MAGVPGNKDVVAFGAAGNHACTLTRDVSWSAMSVASGYTAKFDMGPYDIALADDGDLVAAGGGEFDCGSGTSSLVDGDFANAAQATWTYGTGTLQMAGTGTLTSDASHDIYALIIESGATITLTTDMDVHGDLVAHGALLIASGKTLTVSGNAEFHDDLTGSGGVANLSVSGTNVAHNGTITNIDASGGTELNATDNCGDGHGNTKVRFAAASEGRLSPMGLPFAA